MLVLTQIPKLLEATSESAASGATESPPADEEICSSAGGGVERRRGAPNAFGGTGFGPKGEFENQNVGLNQRAVRLAIIPKHQRD